MIGRAVLMPAALARLARGVARGGAQAWLRAADALLLRLACNRERRHLETLSDHMLKDAGLSRADADREARKPFWRP